MAYIGLEPSNSFVSLKRQVITGDGTASYTLDHSVASVNDVAIFVNNVRQDPAGYSISGAALTLGGTIESSDDCYVIFLGQALQTVTPDSDTITTAMLKSNAVTSAKLTYPLTTFSSTGIDDNADATAMTITSAEDVGIGETTPIGKFHVKTADTGASAVSGSANELVIENTGNVGMTIQSANDGVGNIYFGDVANGSVGRVSYDHSNNFMSFNANAAERMRIDSSGSVLIGHTAEPTGSTGGAGFINDTNDRKLLVCAVTNTGARELVEFRNPNGTVGKIETSSSATSYSTSSDYRLKENVNYDFDATTRLKQLRPARFNFIADADTTVDGFIAHEVSSVVPEAISGTKDAVQVWQEGDELPEGVSVGDNKLDENGNTIPEYQGIDQAKLVPLLVKTIQELEARITTLEDA